MFDEEKPTPEEIDEIIEQQNRESLAQHYEEMDRERDYYNELPEQLIVSSSNPDKLIKYDKRKGAIKIEEIDVCKETEISRLADRRILDQTERFIVDEILPAGQIHVLAGPSGAGKTRWLLPTIKAWYEGKDVLGYKSNPEPYLYISCDRSSKSLNQTLKKLKLQDWDLYYKTIPELLDDIGIVDYEKFKLESIINYYTNIKVFFIEAMAWFQQMGNKVNEYNANLRYWTNLQKIVEERDITIVATTHQPKSNPKDRHENPRERIMGSVAMGAIVDTIFLLEFDDVKDVTNKSRVMRILPRNVEASLVHYRMTEGGSLEPYNKEDLEDLVAKEEKIAQHKAAAAKTKLVIMDTVLIINANPEITTEEIRRYAEINEIGKTTYFQWIKDKLETGELIRVREGLYKKGRLF